MSRVAITLLAAVMMTVLCTSPVRKVFRFAMEPKMEWFFKRDAGAEARAREKGSAVPPGQKQPAAPAAPEADASSRTSPEREYASSSRGGGNRHAR